MLVGRLSFIPWLLIFFTSPTKSFNIPKKSIVLSDCGGRIVDGIGIGIGNGALMGCGNGGDGSGDGCGNGGNGSSDGTGESSLKRSIGK